MPLTPTLLYLVVVMLYCRYIIIKKALNCYIVVLLITNNDIIDNHCE